jgi:chloramphenicol-sensitive protein RarD
MSEQQLSEPVGDGLVIGQEARTAEAARPLSDQKVAGLVFGLATYLWWGLQPVYFKLLQTVPPAAMVAHRTAYCALLMVLVVTVLRRWPQFLGCLSKRLVLLLTCSSLLLATNWLFYIASVVTGRIVESSLGYFINPLFSVLLGIVFLRERPARLQIAAIVLAAIGITYIVCRFPYVPWIAFGVAGTFGLYGLVRKVARVESLNGLTLETGLLTPLAAGYLIWQSLLGNDVFGGLNGGSRILVLASGAITAVPLLFFGAAARRLPLSTLGFLQFAAPSLQLALAVLLYGEPFNVDHAVSFGFIWAGLILFSIDTVMTARHRAVLRGAASRT